MEQQKLTPAEFYWEPVKNNFRSKEEGRDIYEKKEFIRFFMPGGHPWCRKVQDKDKQERPLQYEQFKAKEKQTREGTPLDIWPLADVAQVAELKHLNIETVEELANYPRASMGPLGMGAISLQQKAKTWLQAAKDSSYASKLAHDMETLRSDKEALENQVKELQKKFDELEREKKGKKK